MCVSAVQAKLGDPRDATPDPSFRPRDPQSSGWGVRAFVGEIHLSRGISRRRRRRRDRPCVQLRNPHGGSLSRSKRRPLVMAPRVPTMATRPFRPRPGGSPATRLMPSRERPISYARPANGCRRRRRGHMWLLGVCVCSPPPARALLHVRPSRARDPPLFPEGARVRAGRKLALGSFNHRLCLSLTFCPLYKLK